MLEPLVLIGGLVNIPMYVYYWVMTAAQIELMAMDTPVVSYNHKKDKESEPTKAEMDKLTERWMQRKKEREEKGLKVNLSDFLRKGVEALPHNTNTK